MVAAALQGVPIARSNERRSHTKSKLGCVECKRRRIKCNEERPKCRSCRRHGSPCVYATSPPVSRPGTRSRPASERPDHRPTPSSPRSDRELVGLLTDTLPVVETVPDHTSTTRFDLNDMALLHHWTISTSREIVRCSQVDHCWQSIFPKIASKHSFVMHGILSLAALHLAYTDGDSREEHTVDAIRHHNKSLQGFRENILHIGEKNSDALFVSSTLNIIYVFGMSRRPSCRSITDVDPRHRIARALGTEWIPMIRGVQAVLHRVYDHVRLGPLSPLLNLGNWHDLDIDGEPFPDDEHLRRVQDTCAQGGEAENYRETLQILRRCYLYVAQFKTMDERSLERWGYNRHWAGPLVFLHSAPDEYFTRLHQRQPPALVIFAYFGALLHGLNDSWFLEGLGRDIVEVVDEILGDYWRFLTDRPRQVVGIM